MVIWLTGLPASGKSTLAELIYRDLTSRGYEVSRLDGDALRSQFPETGFSRQDRDLHVRRAGDIAARLEGEGIIVVASLISPYRQSRAYVRSRCKQFVEVYVKASVGVCEKRDPKGLYAGARRGEVKNLTGVDDPYEEPEHAELVLDTERESLEESFSRLKDFVHILLSPV